MGRNRLLVPGAQPAMAGLKEQVKASEGIALPNEEQKAAGVGAAMTTKEAGELGGAIGGQMVRRLVEMAKAEFSKQP